jgi:hypothetical protein
VNRARVWWAWLRRLFTYEPAVAAWAGSGGLAVLAAWVFGLTSAEEAAVATAVTAAATIYTAVQTRPADVPSIIGGLTTIVTAAAAFGFHPPAHWIALGTAAASVILPLVLRVNLTPAVTYRRQVLGPPPGGVGFGPPAAGYDPFGPHAPIRPIPVDDPPSARQSPPRVWNWPIG